MYVISGLCVPGLRVFYDLFKFLLSSRKERSADCSAPFAAGPAGLILGMGLNHMVIAAGSCGRFFALTSQCEVIVRSFGLNRAVVWPESSGRSGLIVRSVFFLHFEVVFQFFSGGSVGVVKVTDERSFFHQGDARTEVYGVAQVVT